MIIGIDGRHLQGEKRSGVGTYAEHMLRVLSANHRERHGYLLFQNGFFGKYPYHWPNSLLHPCSRFLRIPKIDRLMEQKEKKSVDLFYSPNLHFTALQPGTPHVITIHDLSFELYPECYSLKQRAWHHLVEPRRQCEAAAAIIVPSEHTKEDIMRLYHISSEKIHVIYPGVPDGGEITDERKDRVKKKYNLPERFIFFLGTLEPRKNIEGILLAYQASGLFEQGFFCVIAGQQGWKYTPYLRLMQKIPGVRYLGYIDDEEKQSIYMLARLCVFPSFYEGFGFPVIEAMQAGTPVLTSNRSSLSEITSGAAYLVNPYRVGEITEGMRWLVSDEALRELLATKGREVVKRYSWERAGEELLDVFDRVK